MADIPISGLPAAASLAGPDLVPAVQAGVTKKGTVSMLLDAATGVPAVASVGLTDKILAGQGTSLKNATPQQIFNALALLTAAAGISTADLMTIMQAGVAKQAPLSDIIAAIPAATSGAKGLMSVTDKNLLDTHTSGPAVSCLAEFSPFGGMRLGGLQLCATTSGATIRTMAVKTLSATLVGGTTNESFDRDITSYGFAGTPNFAFFWGYFASLYAIHGNFLGWTTTNMRFNVRRFDGGVLSAGTFSADCIFGRIENGPP